MKHPKDMTTEELIELADEIKRDMTKKFFKEIGTFRKVHKIKNKKTISKKEAIMIADRVKSGMSIKVMKDLEELKKAQSKALQEIKS